MEITKVELTECAEKINKCRTEAAKRIVGQKEVADGIITALIAGGHVLLEGVPGLAKTLAVKTFSEISGLAFKRIQFTPDLLPADITGTLIYEQATGNFTVRKGPVFANLVLADEINRAPAKVQSALLEAMEEHQVTIDGKTYPLPPLFMVIATENPVEQIGTYMLPEAQLDRFLMKLSIGYPVMDMQIKMAKKYLEGALDEELTPVVESKDIIKMREEMKQVVMTDELVEYALNIVDKSRSNENLEYGLSPRAALDLLTASKSAAYVAGRDYVIPEDIINMTKITLPHRLVFTTQSKMNRYTGYQLIVDIIDKVNRPR